MAPLPSQSPALFESFSLSQPAPFNFSSRQFLYPTPQGGLFDFVDQFHPPDLDLVHPEAEAFQCQCRSLNSQGHQVWSLLPFLSSSSLPSFSPQITTWSLPGSLPKGEPSTVSRFGVSNPSSATYKLCNLRRVT